VRVDNNGGSLKQRLARIETLYQRSVARTRESGP